LNPVIFVDTNVFMYVVGQPHPLQARSRALLAAALAPGAPELVTSAEILQEMLHAYRRRRQTDVFDTALTLLRDSVREIWGIEPDDVTFARGLADAYPGLSARDLLHLACCRRRGVTRIHTFDRRLAAAVRKGRL
jgi:hypothetical protein